MHTMHTLIKGTGEERARSEGAERRRPKERRPADAGGSGRGRSEERGRLPAARSAAPERAVVAPPHGLVPILKDIASNLIAEAEHRAYVAEAKVAAIKAKAEELINAAYNREEEANNRARVAEYNAYVAAARVTFLEKQLVSKTATPLDEIAKKGDQIAINSVSTRLNDQQWSSVREAAVEKALGEISIVVD